MLTTNVETLTPEMLAALLDGNQYRNEMTPMEEANAKASGLVVVFGGSDDLIEFRGAIDDEQGAGQGTEILVDARGLLPDRDNIEDDDELQDYFARKPWARTITTVWAQGDHAWQYRTDIPHATFEVMDDGEKYCKGIVFRLADAATRP
jgi:hypothetical protein